MQKPLLGEVDEGGITETNISLFLFLTTFHTQRQFPALFSSLQGIYGKVLLRDAWSKTQNLEHPALCGYSKSNPERPAGGYLLPLPPVSTTFLFHVLKGGSSCLEDNVGTGEAAP